MRKNNSTLKTSVVHMNNSLCKTLRYVKQKIKEMLLMYISMIHQCIYYLQVFLHKYRTVIHPPVTHKKYYLHLQ